MTFMESTTIEAGKTRRQFNTELAEAKLYLRGDIRSEGRDIERLCTSSVHDRTVPNLGARVACTRRVPHASTCLAVRAKRVRTCKSHLRAESSDNACFNGAARHICVLACLDRWYSLQFPHIATELAMQPNLRGGFSRSDQQALCRLHRNFATSAECSKGSRMQQG